MTTTEILGEARLARLIDRVIDREGRTYTETPGDRGGATKFGQTRVFLADLLGRPVSKDEVRSLTEDQARIYYARFLEKYGFWRLTAERLLDHVVDFAVHTGPGAPIRALQVALGIAADGKLGPITAALANGGDVELLGDRVMAARLELLGALLRRPDQGIFALGWLRRIGTLLVWRPA